MTLDQFKQVWARAAEKAAAREKDYSALDLCTIAAGRAELFFELVLSPWDYAAGALIVEEAGGLVSDCDGHPLAYDRPCSVLARNKTVQLVNP